MRASTDQVIRFRIGTIKLEVHPNRKSAGESAARAAAEEMQRLAQSQKELAVIFATGASQFETLQALIALRGLPWQKVVGFHLDEYVALDKSHPASFRRYLRDKLLRLVPMGRFYEIDGTAEDLDAVRREYVQALKAASPQLCLLGIGENAHLAFNDPAEADFQDPQAMKVVTLDRKCREQQAAEGWSRPGKRYRKARSL
jgi:glucosamine-6-phosphate deaminase